MTAFALRAPTACDVDSAVRIAMETACPVALRHALLGLLVPAGTNLSAHPDEMVEAAADEAIASLWRGLEDNLAAARAARGPIRRPRRRAKT